MLESFFCCKNILFICVEVYIPVNSYGHVEPVSYPLTLFLGRLIATKQLTSTWRAGELASMHPVVTDNC